ncbi:MAG: SDR family NAD(P)-dependent oxidoreductase [Vicingaceae bacterium]|nr:SDR family NAD(P)-dependent oxidoreductase [Vicingaceae bacterium]
MNVLITGASRGIGFELVKQFAVNKSNQITALARDYKALKVLRDFCQKEFGNEIHIYSIDFLSDSFSADLDRVFEKYRFHYDIVINNAGYLINKPFLDTSSLDIDNLYKVNVFSPIAILKRVFTFLETGRKCHVVNIGSMGGVQGSVKFSGLSIYSSSKAALANLTECLAEEYKDRNIYINCLALGSVQTEMLNMAFPGFQAQVSPEDMARYIHGFSVQDPICVNGKIIQVSNTTP